MSVNVRRLFKANCGPGARYRRSEMRMRGEYNTVMIAFEMFPEGRKFELDGVLHVGDTDDEMLTNAVLRIALIAKNIREPLAAPDGANSVKVERVLS